MNKENVFNERNPQTVGTEMTAQEFVQLYLKDADFEKYSQALRKAEVEDFKIFFDCLRSGLRMADRNAQGIDRAGKPYRFYSFIRARATTGVKIFPIGEWDRFIREYQDGEIRIGFTAAELAEEALNK
jgi:hypothetical protein